ncbi:hypothetical protein L1987_45606 [Smallanthus sonchifolius]|uniref:Uncharacterized protein n=1 Tax=Smallanthus sonchifolius TaxID=185202 RepID=A0ACB9FYG7_9ASTR|nr:hypothetical protein L1987_45606 [Smallanthus sonchifolius]
MVTNVGNQFFPDDHGHDRANGREEQEATADGLEDIDVDQPLNSPSYVASREESSTQRKRKRRNNWDPILIVRALSYAPITFLLLIVLSVVAERTVSSKVNVAEDMPIGSIGVRCC